MQQPVGKTVAMLPNYTAVFGQTVIPTTMQDQTFPHAKTTIFDDTANNVKEDIIIVDSRYRNWDNETQSNYTYYLGQQMEYVQSLELVDGYVINSPYVINLDNNCLTFIEKSDIITVEIPIGIYNISQLCDLIGELMTESSQNNYTYTCHVNPQLDKIVISSLDHHEKFDLLWADGTEILEDGGLVETIIIDPITRKKIPHRVQTGRTRQTYRRNSVGKILGFLPVDMIGHHIYTGQQVYNLYPDAYVAIHVTTENNDDCKNVISHVNAVGNTGAFAILELSQSLERPQGTANRQYTSRRRFTRFFNPPVKFTKLRIEIKKPDGAYYDFHGVDHYLFFIVQRVYNRKVLSSVNHLF
jgi:hypothetical protein